MNTNTILNVGKLLFWSSFLSGSICLLGYLFTREYLFAEGGLLVLRWGFIINLSAVLGLLLYGIIKKAKLAICLKSILIMITNIPIAIIYLIVGIWLLCNI